MVRLAAVFTLLLASAAYGMTVNRRDVSPAGHYGYGSDNMPTFTPAAPEADAIRMRRDVSPGHYGYGADNKPAFTPAAPETNAMRMRRGLLPKPPTRRYGALRPRQSAGVCKVPDIYRDPICTEYGTIANIYSIDPTKDSCPIKTCSADCNGGNIVLTSDHTRCYCLTSAGGAHSCDNGMGSYFVTYLLKGPAGNIVQS